MIWLVSAILVVLTVATVVIVAFQVEARRIAIRASDLNLKAQEATRQKLEDLERQAADHASPARWKSDID